MIKAGIVDALLESNIEFVVAGRMASEQIVIAFNAVSSQDQPHIY